jgi:hypothetical protein
MSWLQLTSTPMAEEKAAFEEFGEDAVLHKVISPTNSVLQGRFACLTFVPHAIMDRSRIDMIE